MKGFTEQKTVCTTVFLHSTWHGLTDYFCIMTVSSFTATPSPELDPPHAAGQDRHSYTPCWSDPARNVPAVSGLRLANEVGQAARQATSIHLITQHPGTPWNQPTPTFSDQYYDQPYLDIAAVQTGHIDAKRGSFRSTFGGLRFGASSAGWESGYQCDDCATERLGRDHILLADLACTHRLGGSEVVFAKGCGSGYRGLGVSSSTFREPAFVQWSVFGTIPSGLSTIG